MNTKHKQASSANRNKARLLRLAKVLAFLLVLGCAAPRIFYWLTPKDHWWLLAPEAKVTVNGTDAGSVFRKSGSKNAIVVIHFGTEYSLLVISPTERGVYRPNGPNWLRFGDRIYQVHFDQGRGVKMGSGKWNQKPEVVADDETFAFTSPDGNRVLIRWK